VVCLDLYLLRHGEAGKRPSAGSSISQRSLSINGEKEVEDISRSLNTLGIRFDFIVTSPLKQAYLTAVIVAKTFEVQKKIQEWSELTPEGNRLDLYHKLSQFKQGSTILLVGHQPYLSNMISEIIFGISGRAKENDRNYNEANIVLKKAGLARIRITSLIPEISGELLWLLTPRLLKRLQNVRSKTLSLLKENTTRRVGKKEVL
jgi:phosphohistidine phosphatase